MNEDIVKVEHITKRIKGKVILDDISFNIKKGTILGLVGPNGAGKTTLLKIMTGLYHPDSGDVYYDNVSLTNDYEKSISNVGCLIENPDLYRNISGYNNIKIFSNMYKNSNIDNSIKYMNLKDKLYNKVNTYSLGMKERLGISCALVSNPKILILDEPTNGLDPIGIKDLRNSLKSMKDTTIIISSHLISEIENICDEVIFINEGKIIERKELHEQLYKKNIEFEVDDYSKARCIIKEFRTSENLTMYATDEEISQINKKLVLNNIKVYRIIECQNSLEKEFFDKLGVNND